MINKIKNEVDDATCSFCKKTSQDGTKMARANDGVICKNCVETLHVLFEGKELEKQKQKFKTKTPKELNDFLNQFVIGQDDAKRTLAVAVYKHYQKINNKSEFGKSNVLLIGPSGSGKTLLAQTLAKTIGVPFAMADATNLTEAGYVGDDVENIIQKLLVKADYDVEQTERGIVFIDEIDKIGRKSSNPSLTRDVSGEGVQQALLKMIEGSVTSVPPQGGRKHPNQEMIQVDTSKILFICGGAFEGLVEQINSKKEDTTIGFMGNVDKKDITDEKRENLYKEVKPEDLVKYGLIQEFVGRLPVITTLNPLREEDLVRIIKEPKNSILEEFISDFKLEGVELVIEDDSITAIAKKAIANKTGARSLRTEFEKILKDAMFEVPSDKTITKVLITKEIVEENKNAILVREEIKQVV